MVTKNKIYKTFGLTISRLKAYGVLGDPEHGTKYSDAQFIAVFEGLCLKFHGDKYDYGQIDIFGEIKNKYTLECKDHGFFKINWKDHFAPQPELKRVGWDFLVNDFGTYFAFGRDFDRCPACNRGEPPYHAAPKTSHITNEKDVVATKKPRDVRKDPINVLYIWEALDFESEHKVIKIGTTRSYRGIGRIIEVAETWKTRYKLLHYIITKDAEHIEKQLLYIGTKYFTERNLDDGATEFRVIDEQQYADIEGRIK